MIGDVQARPAMRFNVEGWDPAYGSSLELEDYLGESTARVDPTVEEAVGRWRPLDPDPGRPVPEALLFVDGVRRIEAQIWIDDHANGAPPASATAALCASYAAGVVCCCRQQAHLVLAERRRGLFTIAAHATNISTWAGDYVVSRTAPSAGVPLAMTLSQALQRRLAEIELETAIAARDAVHQHGAPPGGDLLVIDGPLRGRQHLPRAIGYIKSHRSTYLPAGLNAVVGSLAAGQRTPVFLMGTSWDRHSWYLRLPAAAGAPWAGIVRVECSADLPLAEVLELAGLSQLCLGRFASTEYKDGRAPQNLYPIAGLERELRRRLGDARLLYRALRQAASRDRSLPGRPPRAQPTCRPASLARDEGSQSSGPDVLARNSA
jgi:hypothetical protein